MAAVADPEASIEAERPPPPPPLVVEYDPITGIPSEYNEYLPSNCEEYKRWKAAKGGSADAAAEAVSSLTIGEGAAPSTAAGGGEAAGAEAPSTSTAEATPAPATDAAPPKKKKSSKNEPSLVLEVTSRGKKKSVTTISGLDLFGVKLPEASKMLGKKFACGCSVTKTAEAGKEQVEVQGDVVARAAPLLVETYGKGEGVPGFPLLTKGVVYSVIGKKKEKFFADA